MSFLFLRAYQSLVIFDGYIRRNDFGRLYRRVRNCPVAPRPPLADAVDRIGYAIDLASIWYWKKVLCLQRSAATVWLLKRHGVRAELVIGVQQLPFRAHAWVEVSGKVTNDKPYISEIYAVVERC